MVEVEVEVEQYDEIIDMVEIEGLDEILDEFEEFELEIEQIIDELDEMLIEIYDQIELLLEVIEVEILVELEVYRVDEEGDYDIINKITVELVEVEVDEVYVEINEVI